MKSRINTSSLTMLPEPLQREVRAVMRSAPLLKGLVFTLDALALALTMAILRVAMALAGEDALSLLLLLLPSACFVWIICTQSERTRRFLISSRVAQSHPYVLYLRGSDADDDPTEIHFEDSLVQALAPIGPTVIVDRKAWYRRSGAIRIPPIPPSQSWTAAVGDLADHARLVVFRLGPRRGYRPREDTVDDNKYDRAALDGVWLELELMPVERFRGHCLVFVGGHWDNRPVQLTNANGSLDLGVSTLLAEIRNFTPREFSSNWPEDLGGSRWLWFDPSGTPKPLGAPGWLHSRLNSPKRMRHDLCALVAHFGSVPRVAPRAISEIVALMSLSLILWIAFGQDVDVGANVRDVLVLTGGLSFVGLAWIYRSRIRYAINLWRYGTYDNFVWPPYMYNPQARGRPKRRSDPTS